MIGCMLGLLFCNSGWANEQKIRQLLNKQYPHLKEVPIKGTPIKGIFEVNIDGNIAYTNENLDFLLVGGSLINPKTFEDITANSKKQAAKDFIKSIPLEWAVKHVYGKGERILITFENPDCPNCRRQADIFKEDENKLNATVYTFVVPLSTFPDSERKARFIYCSKNPGETWKQWIRWRGDMKSVPIPLKFDAPGKVTIENGSFVLDPSVNVNCPASLNVDKSRELFDRLGYNSTPRHIFADGSTARGWMTLEELEKGFQVVKSKESK